MKLMEPGIFKINLATSPSYSYIIVCSAFKTIFDHYLAAKCSVHRPSTLDCNQDSSSVCCYPSCALFGRYMIVVDNPFWPRPRELLRYRKMRFTAARRGNSGTWFDAGTFAGSLLLLWYRLCLVGYITNTFNIHNNLCRLLCTPWIYPLSSPCGLFFTFVTCTE